MGVYKTKRVGAATYWPRTCLLEHGWDSPYRRWTLRRCALPSSFDSSPSTADCCPSPTAEVSKACKPATLWNTQSCTNPTHDHIQTTSRQKPQPTLAKHTVRKTSLDGAQTPASTILPPTTYLPHLSVFCCNRSSQE